MSGELPPAMVADLDQALANNQSDLDQMLNQQMELIREVGTSTALAIRAAMVHNALHANPHYVASLLTAAIHLSAINGVESEEYT